MALKTHYGTDGADTIKGTSGHWPDGDAIYGYGGDDTIYAGDGWDYITGGEGADYIDGGGAFDQAIYKDSSVGVTVILTDLPGAKGFGYGGTAEGDVLVNIENLAGSEFADVLAGNSGRNELYGRDGNDTLKGGGGYDRLSGDAGNDILIGGTEGDYMHGGSGYDTASYEGSSAGVVVSLITDSAHGGDATGDQLDSIENLTGSRHADNLYGDNGSNVLKGMDGADTLKGYGGHDTLLGGNGNDNLQGMDGYDYLDGGAGADSMMGGRDGDSYRVDNAGDTVTEYANEGYDTVSTSLAGYTLSANVEYLSFDNAAGAGIYGIGNDLGNTIIGNDFSNLLDGRAGADLLYGGGGVDNFVFRAGQANGDHISDFNGLGAGTGDSMIFLGYGTIAEGATFRQLTATTWEIGSADGTIKDVITFDNAATVDFSDFVFA